VLLQAKNDRQLQARKEHNSANLSTICTIVEKLHNSELVEEEINFDQLSDEAK